MVLHKSYAIGMGQGITRILQLSGFLAADAKDVRASQLEEVRGGLLALQRLNLTYWNTLVDQFFTDKATMKLTLWKDNQQVEAKPFGAVHAHAGHDDTTDRLTQKLDIPFFRVSSWSPANQV